MQGWTATTRHGVTRKRGTKRLKHKGNLFTKNLQLIGVCLLILDLQSFPPTICGRKETVDIDILVTSRYGDRKIMQSIRITS